MKRMILNNFGVKVLSLLIAAMAWLIIVNIDDPVKIATIRGINVTMINDNALSDVGQCYEVASKEDIVITVEGKKSIVDKLDASDFTAIADVEKMSITNSVPVTVNVNEVYSGLVDIVDGKSSEVIITLDNYITETFPLKIEQTGFITTDYYISDEEMTMSSKNVKISGPEKVISIIDKVVVKVDVSDITEETKKYYTIKAYDNNGSEIKTDRITYSRDNVSVLVKPLLTKNVEVSYTTQGQVNENYTLASVNGNISKVLVAGEATALSKAENIAIKTDISGLKEDTSIEYDLKDYISSNLKIVSKTTTAKVSIDLDALEVRTFTFSAGELKFENLKNNVITNYDSNISLSIKIRGKKDVVDDINLQMLSPHVDVSKMKIGLQNVTIMVNSLEGIEVLMTSSIKIELVDKKKIEDDAKSTSRPSATVAPPNSTNLNNVATPKPVKTSKPVATSESSSIDEP